MRDTMVPEQQTRARALSGGTSLREKDSPMAWSTPVLIEICVGLEINGYLLAEF